MLNRFCANDSDLCIYDLDIEIKGLCSYTQLAKVDQITLEAVLICNNRALNPTSGVSLEDIEDQCCYNSRGANTL
jgi:hypothetical protein